MTDWDGRRGEEIRGEPPLRGCVTAGLSVIRTLRLGFGAEAESKAEWLPPWVDRRLLVPLCDCGGVSGDTEGTVSVSQTWFGGEGSDGSGGPSESWEKSANSSVSVSDGEGGTS